MGIPAETRSILGHLFNISMPYSYANPVFEIACGGIEELSEEFNPDTDTIQYLCEDVKTTNVSGYDISFDVDISYIKGSKMQIWVDNLVRTLPKGGQCEFDYIRFNKAETIYGYENRFIGVRRKGTVYPNSIGGSAGDPLSCNLTIAGSGNSETGYVTVTNVNGHTQFSWTPATTAVPYVSTIGGKTMSEYYSGIEVTATEGEVTISGYGVGGDTVVALKSGGTESTTDTATVDSVTKGWSIDVTVADLATNTDGTKSVAFVQKTNTTPAATSISTPTYTFKVASS